MNFWNRLSDLATNNSNNYKKEKQAYDEANNEIDAIEDLLKVFSHKDIFYEYPEVFRDLSMTLVTLLDFKKVKLKLLANATVDKEREHLKQEIFDLEKEYEITLEEVKNRLLKIKDIQEIQKHVAQLKVIIFKNASFEAFRQIQEQNIEDLTIEKMQNLRNAIAIRNQILIPYLGNFQTKK